MDEGTYYSCVAGVQIKGSKSSSQKHGHIPLVGGEGIKKSRGGFRLCR